MAAKKKAEQKEIVDTKKGREPIKRKDINDMYAEF